MSEKDKILDNYNALFEKDENGKALSEEAFLDRLIALESSGKTRLFRTLLGDKSNQEVREYLNTKGRKEWEKIVSKEYLGKSMTIVDIINQYSKMIKETFKTKPMKEALKGLGIQSEKLDGVILPSEGDQRIKSGNSEGGEEDEEKKRLKFKEYQEKIETLFSGILTVDNGIYLGDLEVFEGKNEKDIVRYTSYIAVKIPKLEKTIFINDREGESTFVCDKLVSEHDMTTKSKKKFREELGDAFHSVSYSENRKEQWKLDMIDLIFGPEKGTQKYIRDTLIDENRELTEKGKEWFRLNVTARKAFKLQDGISYVDIARKFGFIVEEKDELVKDEKYVELTEKIFGVNKKKEDQRKIRIELMDENRELTEKGKEWFALNVRARATFKLQDGISYVDIARKFGFTEKGIELYKDEKYEELTEMIFGLDKKNEYEKQITLEKQMEIREELVDEKGELTAKGREWFYLNTNTRPKFKLLDGRGYVDIARNFGFKEGQHELIRDEQYGELTEKIFGLDKKNEYENQITLEKQVEIREELVDEKGELTAKGREWFSLKTATRKKFKLLDGRGYIDIARKFLFKEKADELYKDVVFYKLSIAIFGEDNENVKILKEKLDKK